MPDFAYDAVIIGTGFGATVAALRLAEKGVQKILMVERGVWWFSPERPMPQYLADNSAGGLDAVQPVQYWPRPDHGQGLAYFLSVVRTNNPLLEAGRKFGEFFSDKKPPQPLYRYNMFDEVDVITASGVGGGSLIYSNVTIEPYRPAGSNQYPVMQNWPLPLAPADYQNARDWMLRKRGSLSQVVTRVPVPPDLLNQLINLDPQDAQHAYLDYLFLRKSRALRVAAQKLKGDPQWQTIHDWAPLDLAILEYDGQPPNDKNHPLNAAKAGAFCERQGRCFLGCLPGARHTLNKTLIDQFFKPDSPFKGQVEVRPLADVDVIRPLDGGGYQVEFIDVRNGHRHLVPTPKVILAAGCLGSTHVLLKCNEQGTLKLSKKLGSGFSANGDFGGFVTVPRDFKNPVYPIFPTRGPINTAHVMFRNGETLVNVEDSAVPPMFASLTRAALEVLSQGDTDPFINAIKMAGMWISGNMPDLSPFLPPPDPSNPSLFQTEHEIAADVFFFNTMGTDKVRGTFKLDGDGDLDLSFPGGKLANDPVFQKSEELLKAMADKMGGKFIPFPTWKGFADRKVVVVHPLGGCPMGQSATEGVVDTQGRVFNTTGNKTDQVYPGLYVMDASILPGAVAVNPTLTIVAMCQRLAQNL
jgi:cholesterol oxidase